MTEITTDLGTVVTLDDQGHITIRKPSGDYPNGVWWAGTVHGGAFTPHVPFEVTYIPSLLRPIADLIEGARP